MQESSESRFHIRSLEAFAGASRRQWQFAFLNSLLLVLLVGVPFSRPAMGSMRAVSDEDLELFNIISEKFSSDTFEATVEKKLTLEMLQQERKSTGLIQLQKGRIRLEMKGDENSLLVVNSKKLYAVTYPAAALKGAKVNVIETDVSNKQLRRQGLLALMAKGGLKKTFEVTGVMPQSAGKEMIYFLSPKAGSEGLSRAQVRVNVGEKVILQLKYWDDLNNETSFAFSDQKMLKLIPWKRFEYIPPPDADVIREK